MKIHPHSLFWLIDELYQLAEYPAIFNTGIQYATGYPAS
jgi:hypothetical protein